MRTIGMPSRRNMRRSYVGILLIALCASGCRGTKQVDSLQKFVQDGQRTLFEVTDKGGRSWKIGSVKAASVTSYFVVSSDGRVNIIATAFDDSLGAKHAVVFVDPTDKEEALAVLDRKFLSGLGNASDPYRRWLDENSVFTYGSVQDTHRFDVEKGRLGSSNIRVEGNAIVGLMNDIACHCSDRPLFCHAYPSSFVACFNKVCDYVNCNVGIINGSGSNCAQEASDAITTCQVAAGVPQ